MIPCDGNIEWYKIKSQIEHICYKGPISLEVVKRKQDKYENLSAEEFLRTAFVSATKI